MMCSYRLYIGAGDSREILFPSVVAAIDVPSRGLTDGSPAWSRRVSLALVFELLAGS
jgi:hypothetical protein